MLPRNQVGQLVQPADLPFAALLTGSMYGGVVRQWRSETLKLPRRSMFGGELIRAGNQPVPVLYSFSRHVLQPPKDWSENVHVTGYWILDETNCWQPPPELLNFLDAGPPPVFVGFGSMGGRNPARTTSLVLEALAKTGQRGLLVTGWGGLETEELPDNVFKVENAPYDWLFPRMFAVVHHGGQAQPRRVYKQQSQV